MIKMLLLSVGGVFLTVGTYGLTHKKILNSAKMFFLKYSYEGTNLCDLCKACT